MTQLFRYLIFIPKISDTLRRSPYVGAWNVKGFSLDWTMRLVKEYQAQNHEYSGLGLLARAGLSCHTVSTDQRIKNGASFKLPSQEVLLSFCR